MEFLSLAGASGVSVIDERLPINRRVERSGCLLKTGVCSCVILATALAQGRPLSAEVSADGQANIPGHCLGGAAVAGSGEQ